MYWTSWNVFWKREDTKIWGSNTVEHLIQRLVHDFPACYSGCRSNLIRNIHALNTRVTWDLISGGKLEKTAELTVAVFLHKQSINHYDNTHFSSDISYIIWEASVSLYLALESFAVLWRPEQTLRWCGLDNTHFNDLGKKMQWRQTIVVFSQKIMISVKAQGGLGKHITMYTWSCFPRKCLRCRGSTHLNSYTN